MCRHQIFPQFKFLTRERKNCCDEKTCIRSTYFRLLYLCLYLSVYCIYLSTLFLSVSIHLLYLSVYYIYPSTVSIHLCLSVCCIYLYTVSIRQLYLCVYCIYSSIVSISILLYISNHLLHFCMHLTYDTKDGQFRRYPVILNFYGTFINY